MTGMSRLAKVLLLMALVVPVTAYVAGSLASAGNPVPTDHSPVILRDAPDRGTSGPSRQPDPQRPTERPAPPRPGQQDGDQARVVTPPPVPVGEDDDDWDDDRDDDGPDDDDTDDRADGGDD